MGNVDKGGGGGGVTRKGGEKIERGFDPQRNFDTSATAIYHTFANPILDFEDFGIVKNEISEHLVFFVSWGQLWKEETLMNPLYKER